MRPQQKHPTQPSVALSLAIEPYRRLHSLWRLKLIERHGPNGWFSTMFQLYFTMRATAPMLEYAAKEAQYYRIEIKDFEDWAYQHASEEKEHYTWLLEDLEKSGCERSAIVSNIPNEHILPVIGTQFSLISAGHPLAILGYFYAMECRPSNPQLIRENAKSLRLPDEAIRTILYHTEVDHRHKEEIIKMVDRYGVDQKIFETFCVASIGAILGWTRYFQCVHETPSLKPVTKCCALRTL